MDKTFLYSKKGQREADSFFSDQLLYDYINGHLDAERIRLVENYFKSSLDGQKQIERIKQANEYLDALSDTQTSKDILIRVGQNKSFIYYFLNKFNYYRLPTGFKWGLEALGVLSMVVILLMLIPWQRSLQMNWMNESSDLILAETFKVKSIADVYEPAEYIDETKSGQKSGEVVGAEEETESNADAIGAASTGASDSSKASTRAVISTAPEHVASDQTVSMQKSVIGGGGFLYRGNLKITNLEMVQPKITDKIKELGGRKAGSVELGWKKNPQTAYYHFIIPEAKYDELMKFLSIYGSTKLAKEKHPRVMPDGIVRLIVTLEEAKQ